MAHRFAGQLIIEFVRASRADDAYDNLYPMMRTFVTELENARDLDALCRLAVREVKRITGFGRVKIYRFDAEGNGLVLAEEADPGYASYLGLRFPAADIPGPGAPAVLHQPDPRCAGWRYARSSESPASGG